MRVLSVLAVYPPHHYGGAEISALNLMDWLSRNGHDVACVTTCGNNEKELFGERVGAARVWRLRFPRPYVFWEHIKASRWWKPLWYLQDHFDPRNRWLMGRVVGEFKPDVMLVHGAAGIGFNSLSVAKKMDIPLVYFLHDMNLVCLWGGMFEKGRRCERQCLKCRVASRIRFGNLSGIRRLGFCSPSQANLKALSRHIPILSYAHVAALNANRYPAPTLTRKKNKELRLLYVGRVEVMKGIGLNCIMNIWNILTSNLNSPAFWVELCEAQGTSSSVPPKIRTDTREE